MVVNRTKLTVNAELLKLLVTLTRQPSPRPLNIREFWYTLFNEPSINRSGGVSYLFQFIRYTLLSLRSLQQLPRKRETREIKMNSLRGKSGYLHSLAVKFR